VRRAATTQEMDSNLDILLDRIAKLPITYVGNKKRLLNPIHTFLRDNNVEFNSVLDAFAGSGVVSLMFSCMRKKVVANDALSLAALSCVFLLEGRRLPLSPQEVRSLVALNANLNESLLDKKSEIFLPEEINFLKSFRRNLAEASYSGNMLYTGKSTHGDNLIRICEDMPMVDTLDKHKAAFAMHAMCTNMLSTCFRGGRCFKDQVFSSVAKRMELADQTPKELFLDSQGEESLDNSGRAGTNNTVLHKARAFLGGMTPATLELLVSIERNHPDPDCQVYNCDVIDLLTSGLSTDLIYLDPPYGGLWSNYAISYGVCEEFIHGKPLQTMDHVSGAMSRFSPKGNYVAASEQSEAKENYRRNFDNLLDLCTPFPVWLISFNGNSFSTINEIVERIRRFRSNVIFQNIDGYSYKCRKALRTRRGAKASYKESEFLILARK